ncbi:MAG: tetratricopeptide repeat protein [Treponema sp.]
MSLYLISFIIALAFCIFLLSFIILRSLISPQKTAGIEKYIKAGKYVAAIKRAKAIIAKNPRDAKAHYLLGKAYLADGRAELALIEFKTVNKWAVFENKAQEQEFRLVTAQLYERFQQHEEALAEYALLIKINPDNAEYHYALGQLFEQMNKTEQAITHYRKVISLKPKHASAHAALGLLLFKCKMLTEAKQEIGTALSLEPDNTTALFYHGRLLRETKEYAKALVAFEKAARNGDLRQKAYTERGLCYMDANSIEKAVFEFERALKLITSNGSPDTLRLRYAAGACYEQMRNLDRAIEQWEAIQAVSPRFKDVPDKLAQYCDIHANDYMKEYLTVSADGFLQLCRAITEQAFNLSVQSQKEIKQGCAVIAIEDNTEKWRNVRKQPKIFIYSRDTEIIGDNFLRSLQEQMKTQGLVRAFVVTSSGFSRGALSFAENRPIELIDKTKLELTLKKLKGI